MNNFDLPFSLILKRCRIPGCELSAVSNLLVLVVSISSLVFPTQLFAQSPLDSKLASIVDTVNSNNTIVNSVFVYQNETQSSPLALSYGFANPENSEAMSADHQFRIASMTKSMSAALVLKLVDAGQLTLETTLGEISQNLALDGLFPNHEFGLFDTDERKSGSLTFDDLHVINGKKAGRSRKYL